jgi:hypothetical protein
MADVKRVALWTLVASALLLSAAYAQSPSPMATPKPRESATLSNQKGQRQETLVGPPAMPQPQAADRPATKQQDGSDTSTVVITVFAVISGVATALLAWFNWRLVGVTDEMKKATSEAAKAARESAEAARLALNAEKPYVFLEPIRIDEATQRVFDPIGVFLPPPYQQTTKITKLKWLSIKIRNRGKGIAVIEEIYVRPCIVERRTRKIARGERLAIAERVIGAGEQSETGTYLPDKVAPPIFDSFDKRFAVVGYVRYRDVYERRYKSTFGYYYAPGALNLLRPETPYFFLAAEKHNRIQEQE